MRFTIILFLCTGATFGQTFSIGIKGGAPLTENFQTGSGAGEEPNPFSASTVSYSSKTRRYTVGPTVSWRLPRRLVLEVDALYRQLDYDSFKASSAIRYPDYSALWSSYTANRIDVPVLLRWPVGSRAYAVAGPALAIHYGFHSRFHLIDDRFLEPRVETFSESSVVSAK